MVAGGPFKQADPADRNSPDAYGATVWDNVSFADTYYQTRGAHKGGPNQALVPRGRPIPGAFNAVLTTELPDNTTYNGLAWRPALGFLVAARALLI